MEMFKLIPSVADYIWGGRRLIEEYGIKTDKDPAAEAWVLSCHSAGPSTVEDGEFKGLTLEQVWENHKEICGTNGNKFEFFPILIKFIDAKNNLSIQVHPDNDYAMRVEGEYGKTEAWYILDCDDDAELILGFNREVSVDEFKKAAQSEEMLNIVNKVKVKKGDLFFIESGTLHAICKGILLAEVQQNSNTTYRVYDYGRVGADGKPRPLHIDKAADVTKLCPPTIPNANERITETSEGGKREHLTECDLFKMFSLEIDGKYIGEAGSESFVSLLCLDGDAQVSCAGKTLNMIKGESLFIPASSGKFEIAGKAHFLETRI